MGGEREDVIETAAPKAKARKGKSQAVDVEAGSDTVAQSIRIHEDTKTGQVHFHVDKENIKCGVPVPVWAKAWDRLANAARQGEAEAFDYIDEKNNTVLIVKTMLAEEDGGMSYSVNAELKVRPLAGKNDIYEKLKKFSEAKA